MKTTYKSDIVLGEEYLDFQTGFQGIATGIFFYQHSCERVSIETFDVERKELKTETFDSPRLKSVKTGKIATVTKTGGPKHTPLRPTGIR